MCCVCKDDSVTFTDNIKNKTNHEELAEGDVGEDVVRLILAT